MQAPNPFADVSSRYHARNAVRIISGHAPMEPSAAAWEEPAVTI